MLSNQKNEWEDCELYIFYLNNYVFNVITLCRAESKHSE